MSVKVKVIVVESLFLKIITLIKNAFLMFNDFFFSLKNLIRYAIFIRIIFSLTRRRKLWRF